uniref:Uncharacterized protein n=1 Tax=Anguilla anguilla TaxID=7936 RepID=A0A0E9XCX7_ANGAN
MIREKTVCREMFPSVWLKLCHCLYFFKQRSVQLMLISHTFHTHATRFSQKFYCNWNVYMPIVSIWRFFFITRECLL